MKCRFTKDMEVNPAALSDREREKVTFRKRQLYGRRGGVFGAYECIDAFFAAGTEYEHPNAAFFVRQGVAEPADDECRAACGMTAEQMEAAQRAYFKTENIKPDDWELYDLGVIVGYDDEDVEHDGYAPGPNWDKYWAAQEADEEDE